MKGQFSLILLLGLNIFITGADAQPRQFEGTDFWIALPGHRGTPCDSLEFYIAGTHVNGEDPIKVTVTSAETGEEWKAIAEFDRNLRISVPYGISADLSSGRSNRKSLHLSASVPVYLVVAPSCFYSFEATTVSQPSDEDTCFVAASYYNMALDGGDGIPTVVRLMSIHEGNRIRVSLTTASADGTPADSIINLSMGRGEGIQYLGRTDSEYDDLTGSSAVSSRPMVMYGGHALGVIPRNYGAHVDCFDENYFFEQIPSISSLGSFYVSSSYPRRSYSVISDAQTDLLRVVAAYDSTDVCINGEKWANALMKGEFMDTLYIGSVVLQGSKPVLAAQYAHSQYACGDSVGRPFMTVLAPHEHRRNYSRFYSPDTSRFAVFGSTEYFNYVTVVTEEATIAALRLDGQPVPTTVFRRVAVDHEGKRVFIGTFNVSAGWHELRANVPPEEGFTVQVFGYNNNFGYGYQGGLATRPVTASVERTAARTQTSGEVVTGKLSITFRGRVPDRVDIRDLLGRVVQQVDVDRFSTAVQIDLGHLPLGTYFYDAGEGPKRFLYLP